MPHVLKDVRVLVLSVVTNRFTEKAQTHTNPDLVHHDSLFLFTPC